MCAGGMPPPVGEPLPKLRVVRLGWNMRRGGPGQAGLIREGTRGRCWVVDRASDLLDRRSCQLVCWGCTRTAEGAAGIVPCP